MQLGNVSFRSIVVGVSTSQSCYCECIHYGKEMPTPSPDRRPRTIVIPNCSFHAHSKQSVMRPSDNDCAFRIMRYRGRQLITSINFVRSCLPYVCIVKENRKRWEIGTNWAWRTWKLLFCHTNDGNRYPMLWFFSSVSINNSLRKIGQFAETKRNLIPLSLPIAQRGDFHWDLMIWEGFSLK